MSVLRAWLLEEAQAIQNIRRKDGEETVRRVDVRNEEEVVDRRSGLGKKTDRMELSEVATGRKMRRRRRRTEKGQVTGSIEGFQKAREEEETEIKTGKVEGLTAGHGGDKREMRRDQMDGGESENGRDFGDMRKGWFGVKIRRHRLLTELGNTRAETTGDVEVCCCGGDGGERDQGKDARA